MHTMIFIFKCIYISFIYGLWKLLKPFEAIFYNFHLRIGNHHDIFKSIFKSGKFQFYESGLYLLSPYGILSFYIFKR